MWLHIKRALFDTKKTNEVAASVTLEAGEYVLGTLIRGCECICNEDENSGSIPNHLLDASVQL